jgi:Na+-transporting NADH:ubiquinone oxidoreductase subunit NqrC
VWFASHYLVVDEGKIPRMVIPIHMAGISKLYAVLSMQAANNQIRELRG